MTGTLFLAGFSLGLISSLHCAGMCGPLQLSLPLHKLSVTRRRMAIASYHAGRLLVYTALGGISGVLGRHIYLAGFQQALSIGLGALILLWMVVTHLLPAWGWGIAMRRLFSPLEAMIIRLWRSPSRYGFILLGMANGLLPCGMVYLAVAGAFALPEIGESIAFMLLFGAGTLPVLLTLHYSRRWFGAGTRVAIKKAIPVLMVLMGILLILRGLDLGIPFISPALARGPGPVVSCH